MEELYTLQREVGRGSYGVVFEGRVSRTGQRVAIKRLSCRSPERIELFLQELWAMRATAQNHANVIALHGCLLQTGPRTLKPLRPGRPPPPLVENVLKGRAVRAPRGRDGTVAQRRSDSVPILQDRTNTGHIGPKLQDKAEPEDSATPRRPRSRSGKRPAPSEEDRPRPPHRPAPPRCPALWLVMEFCDGGDLNRYLLSRVPDPRQNHSVVRQLGGAVAFLHRVGVTHRDLKPDNVLVCDTPTGPLVKVADFGLSRVSGGVAGGALTRQNFSSTCGSDFYMAPEVWGGRSYTEQADIFSLGVLFWAVLERITLLEEGSTQEQLGAYVVRGRWLVPLGEALWDDPALQLSIPIKSKRAPPLPPPPGPALCALLADMLASDPDARPGADQLESRVQRALTEDAR